MYEVTRGYGAGLDYGGRSSYSVDPAGVVEAPVDQDAGDALELWRWDEGEFPQRVERYDLRYEHAHSFPVTSREEVRVPLHSNWSTSTGTGLEANALNRRPPGQAHGVEEITECVQEGLENERRDGRVEDIEAIKAIGEMCDGVGSLVLGHELFRGYWPAWLLEAIRGIVGARPQKRYGENRTRRNS